MMLQRVKTADAKRPRMPRSGSSTPRGQPDQDSVSELQQVRNEPVLGVLASHDAPMGIGPTGYGVIDTESMNGNEPTERGTQAEAIITPLPCGIARNHRQRPNSMNHMVTWIETSCQLKRLYVSHKRASQAP